MKAINRILVGGLMAALAISGALLSSAHAAISIVEIQEVEVYGPDDPYENLALGAEATDEVGPRVGSIAGVKPPSNATDGSTGTEWGGFMNIPGSWIEIDLGEDRQVNRVVVKVGGVLALVSGYRITIAPGTDRDARIEIARGEDNPSRKIDTTADSAWLNTTEGQPVTTIGRYVRIEFLSTSSTRPSWPSTFYKVVRSPDEMYSIRNFHYEGDIVTLDLEEGILVPGTTEVGVTVLTIIGTGRYSLDPPPLNAQSRNMIEFGITVHTEPSSGEFTSLFIRLNPENYEDILGSSVLNKIRDADAFVEAERIYSKWFGYSYHAAELAMLPEQNAKSIEVIGALEPGWAIEIREATEYPYVIESEEIGVSHGVAQIDIQHYDIKAEIKPETNMIYAVVRIGFQTADEDSGWAPLILRDNFEVEEVTDDAGNPVEYEFQTGLLYINPGSIPKEGETFWCTVEYSGIIVTDPSSHRIWDFIGPDGTYVRPESRWYPQFPADRATATIEITVPQGLTAVSNGTLEGVSSENGKSTFRWRVDSPPMGFAFTAAGYVKNEASMDGLLLQSYLFPQDSGRSQEYIDKCGEILQFYSKTFGEYPFEKFAVVEIPSGYRGGHGDQSFIMLYENAFKGEPDEEFWAHEISHQWWGNHVGIKRGNGDWLAEGLAVYSSLLFIENKYGREEFLEKLDSVAKVYLGNTGSSAETLLRKANDTVVAYYKAACFFHMLRYLAGEEGFPQILRRLVSDYGGEEIDPFILQDVSEEVIGEDLYWFFNEWLDQPGAPQYDLIWDSTQKPEGGWTVSGAIRQVQGNFRMPVEVAAIVGDQTVRHKIFVQGEETTFSFDVDGEPQNVILDPDHWILRHTPESLSLARINEFDRKGDEFWGQKDYKAALTEYQKALELGPEGYLKGKLLSGMGRCYCKLGEHDKAFQSLTEALPLLPDAHWTTAWTRATLGYVYINKGEYDKAKVEFEAAIAMNATANSVKYASEGLAQLSSIVAVEEDAEDAGLPLKFALSPNFPNPFNPTTEIRYALSEAGPVRLSVFNLLGQKLRVLAEGFREPRTYTVRWDGKDRHGLEVATGVYVVRLEAGEFSQTRRMVKIE